MKKDITTRFDTDKLVHVFYAKIENDPELFPYFEKAIKNESFLEAIKQFWENVVFFTGSYNGNPMEIHKALHEKNPLSKKAFDQWLKLFNESVDELFEGEKASFIKLRAKSIATVMQVKILDSQ